MGAELADPLSVQAMTAILAFQRLIERCGEWEAKEPANHATVLQELEGLYEELTYPTLYTSGLDSLVDGVEALSEIFSLVEVKLAAFKPGPLRSGNLEQDKRLREANAHFAALYPTVKAVTPLQLALQRHFTLMVYNGLSYQLPAGLNGPFASLAKMRDSYFTQPRPELIHQYLATAELAVKTPSYDYWLLSFEDHALRQHWARLEEAGVAIEVLSMLEATEEDAGPVVDSRS